MYPVKDTELIACQWRRAADLKAPQHIKMLLWLSRVEISGKKEAFFIFPELVFLRFSLPTQPVPSRRSILLI
jgi:hypothetical protein